MKLWQKVGLGVFGAVAAFIIIGEFAPDPTTPSPSSPSTPPSASPSVVVIESYTEFGPMAAAQEALKRGRHGDFDGRVVVKVKRKDDYGNDATLPGFTLIWTDGDLERVNWQGTDEYRLLNLARLPNDSVDGVDGAAVLNVWCGPEHRSLTPGFCGYWAKALSGE